MKNAIPYQYDENDIPVIGFDTTADVDWLVARRLLIKGTKKSLKEFKQMEEAEVMIIEEDDLKTGE